jgi:hypothetical protein
MAPQQRDADARSTAAMPGTKLDRRATIRVRAKLESGRRQRSHGPLEPRGSQAVFSGGCKQNWEIARKHGKLATALLFPTA